MHNMPGYPTGSFAIREGAMMAAADQFDITVTGKGGHGHCATAISMYSCFP